MWLPAKYTGICKCVATPEKSGTLLVKFIICFFMISDYEGLGADCNGDIFVFSDDVLNLGKDFL